MQNNNENNMPPQLIFPKHLIDEGREMIRKSHFRKPYKVVKYWQDNPNISDIASRMSKYGLMKVIEIAKKIILFQYFHNSEVLIKWIC